MTGQLRVGFVGTGRLGRPMAANLLRGGFPLAVHDADRGAAAPLVDAGATWAESPAAAAAASDIVITCLPRPEIVAAVVAGDDGVFEGLGPGGVWVDMSTTGTDEIVRLAGLARDAGIDVLEAPVTGGVHKAAAGELTVLVGGPGPVVERVRPVLERLGSRVIHLGELGQASKMKVITNYLAFVHLVAAGEALMLAARSGIDLTDAFEAIRASSGNSFVHETESQVILSGSYDIGFTLDLACKDLDLLHRLARELTVPVELAALVEQRFIQARARYGGEAWSPRVVQILEDDVGVTLRAPGFPETLVEP